jgi:hypothetical protein
MVGDDDYAIGEARHLDGHIIDIALIGNAEDMNMRAFERLNCGRKPN